MHKSVSTIDSPQFLNLTPLDINPLMSEADIKVLYIGQNRNKSCITKAVATEMAKTLRGAPIVGAYKEAKGDFTDHGERVVIDDEGIKFETVTKPYGFVAPDAKVWFQFFEEEDEFGLPVVREYLMTTGYLWTGQFKECEEAVKSGRPQSMELDEDSLDGYWATDSNKNMDFFIINDAIFSKLCILGEDVEPCFEGASITKAQNNFSKMDDSFKTTLFSMIEDLKGVIEGGSKMEDKKELLTEEATEVEVLEEPVVDFKKEEEKEEKEAKEEKAESPKEEQDEKEEEPAKEDSEEEKKKTKHAACGEDEQKKKYELLEEEYTALKTQFAAIEAELNELKEANKALSEFKLAVEEEKKDALIASFYMLSEDDKEDVITNKSKYSLEDIEAKLSIMCVRKKVSFAEEEDNEDTKADAALLYTVENSGESVPAYVSALRNARNR